MCQQQVLLTVTGMLEIQYIPVVYNVSIVIRDQRFLVSSLQDVYSNFIHGEPQVLGKSTGVSLEDIKYSGPIQRPLSDKRQVCFVALLLRQIGIVTVLSGYIFRPYFLAQVLGDIPVNYSPKRT